MHPIDLLGPSDVCDRGTWTESYIYVMDKNGPKHKCSTHERANSYMFTYICGPLVEYLRCSQKLGTKVGSAAEEISTSRLA